MNTTRLITQTLLTLALAVPGVAEAARASRVVKFNGVPASMGAQIKKRFPFAFEREVSLAEIDEIVRYLMKTGVFSGVEAIEREREDGSGRETVVVASLLRKIQDVKVTGAHVFSTGDIVRLLGIEKSQVFERKHLLSAAEDLRRDYEAMGYHNAKVEIDFDLPNESEVSINVAITENQPVRVSDTVIDSTNSDLAKKLAKMNKYLKGKILTEDQLSEFQKTVGDYLAKNRYLTARLGTPSITFTPDRTQARVAYSVENPWEFEFKFSGNSYFSDGKIEQTLQEDKLAGLSSSPAPDMAEKIRRIYQAIGFANVEVMFDEKLDEAAHVYRIAFKIRENPRVRIKKIEITGNISRPDTFYAQFIKSSSSDLIGQGFYNRKDIEEGSKRLVTELQNQGYFRAKIQSQRAEYSKEMDFVTVSLSIDEGPLTQIRQIRFDGVESFPKAQLAEVLKIKTGAALGLKELEDSIAALKNFYRSEGFLEMRISNESEQNRIVTYNEGNTQATVGFEIYEGPRVRVGTITTQGNSFTKDNVILRELAFKQGDVLTPDKIDETIFRLQKLNLFSRVNLRMLEEGTNISERTIIIEVTERDPGLFIYRIGATNERAHPTIRSMIGASYSNIGGTGRGLSLRLEPKYSLDNRVSYLEHVITLSYLEPYIFNDRNRGRVNVVREQLLSEITADEPTKTIIQEANTVGFLLERDLTRNIRLTYDAYSFSNERKFDRYSLETTETLNIGKTGPLIEFDYRDDQWNPTRGWFSYLNLEYSDPALGSSKDATQTINFAKVTGAATKYTRILGRKEWVWVNQLRGGYLANVSSDLHAGVPSQEAFFLGGRSTIRGFNPGDENERVPNKYDLGVDTYQHFRMTSDSYFALIRSEIWFPISGSFGGTIFYDGGAVLISQPDVQLPMPYRDSAGFGIRIATPVGPANLEVGFKLNRRLLRVASDGGYDVRESEYAVHLSIGAL